MAERAQLLDKTEEAINIFLNLTWITKYLVANIIEIIIKCKQKGRNDTIKHFSGI